VPLFTSNEPDNNCGGGDQANDVQPTTQTLVDTDGGTMVFNLRAERCGGGQGRVYSIQCTAVDGSGKSTQTHLRAHDRFVLPAER
jgi:hypothetical protein